VPIRFGTGQRPLGEKALELLAKMLAASDRRKVSNQRAAELAGVKTNTIRDAAKAFAFHVPDPWTNAGGGWAPQFRKMTERESDQALREAFENLSERRKREQPPEGS
jgi:hypothetical protein